MLVLWGVLEVLRHRQSYVRVSVFGPSSTGSILHRAEIEQGWDSGNTGWPRCVWTSV